MTVHVDEMWQAIPTGCVPPRELSLANPYLERQAARESNARSYPRRLPLALSKGKGIYVQDTDGRTYIDCLACAGALALGHNHPVVVEAINRMLRDGLPFQTLDLTTPVKDGFVGMLFDCLPPAFADGAKIQFCGPSGADAVEAAIKLVKIARERRTILAFHGAYHGMTHGTLGLTGHLAPKQALSGLMPDVHFLPFPYEYRCPFGVGGEKGSRLSAAYIERLLDDPNSGVVEPAAMILEVVQGEGGVIPAAKSWLQEIRRMTDERGTGPGSAGPGSCLRSNMRTSCRTSWCCRKPSAAGCRSAWWSTVPSWTSGRRERMPEHSGATSWRWRRAWPPWSSSPQSASTNMRPGWVSGYLPVFGRSRGKPGAWGMCGDGAS